MRLAFLAALVSAFAAAPLSAQISQPTPACPQDRTDGPLYADGTTYYGIPARRYVEAFLSPPNNTHGRVDSGTQAVDASTLRILTDITDVTACRRISHYLSNGTSYANDGRSVYFTAGGFYFVAQWRRAMALSNYTTGYARVMVFDSTFTMKGVYAF
jgi:hypothetical protein